MIELLYCAALGIVVASAAVIALHPDIPGGWFGTLSLWGVAVFGVAGFDRPVPDTWVVGLIVSLAWVCVWALSRWRIEAGRAAKVGGTD